MAASPLILCTTAHAFVGVENMGWIQAAGRHRLPKCRRVEFTPEVARECWSLRLAPNS